jgi:acetyl-CoA acetyltransferase
MRDVHVVAVGMIQFGKYPDKGIKDLTAMAIENLLDHSPVDQDAIEAALAIHILEGPPGAEGARR